MLLLLCISVEFFMVISGLAISWLQTGDEQEFDSLILGLLALSLAMWVARESVPSWSSY